MNMAAELKWKKFGQVVRNAADWNEDGWLLQVDHGAPSDSVRHVGDLGNILANSNGEADFVMVDTVIALEGRNSIIGRAFVIHEGVDDLGRGTSHETNINL